MSRLAFYTLACVLTWSLVAQLAAQEGHPLVGTWQGTWGPNAKDRIGVTIVMFWDGKEVTGMLNPGLDSSKLQKAALDPSNWTVHFESDAKLAGSMVHVVADGKIENLTNTRRSITGAWTQGAVKGDFRITRDN